MDIKTWKPCPECGAQMVARENRKTHHWFMGCVRYPRCKGSTEIPTDYIMRQVHAPMLPGMEFV